MSTIYINTPFQKSEHDAIALLAKANGRSKGQQLRVMVLAALAGAGQPKRGLRTRKGEGV